MSSTTRTRASKRDDLLVVKTCGCGRRYRTAEWRQLPRIGFQIGVGVGEAYVPRELRNCSCDSTLSLRIDLERVVEAAQSSDAHQASAVRTVVDVLQSRIDELESFVRRMTS